MKVHHARVVALLLLTVPLAGCAAPGDLLPGFRSDGTEGGGDARREPAYFTADGPVSEEDFAAASLRSAEADSPFSVRLYAVTALEDARDLQTFVARVKGNLSPVTFRWSYVPLSAPLAGSGERAVAGSGHEVEVTFPQDGLYTLTVVAEELGGRATNASVLLRVGRPPDGERIPVAHEWTGRFALGGTPAALVKHRAHLVGLSDLTLTLSWNTSIPGSVVRATVHQGVRGGPELASAGPVHVLDDRGVYRTRFTALPGNVTVSIEGERGVDLSYEVHLEGLSDPERPVVPYEPEDEAAAHDDEHTHP